MAHLASLLATTPRYSPSNFKLRCFPFFSLLDYYSCISRLWVNYHEIINFASYFLDVWILYTFLLKSIVIWLNVFLKYLWMFFFFFIEIRCWHLIYGNQLTPYPGVLTTRAWPLYSIHYSVSTPLGIKTSFRHFFFFTSRLLSNL